MSRPAALLGLALLAVGCGPRRVEVSIHTPAYCGPQRIGDSGLDLDAGVRGCVLEGVRSFETRVVRVDGVVAVTECRNTPDLCDFDDLRDVRFLTRATPSDGIDIEMTGWSEADCGRGAGVVAVQCDSLGESVIELPNVDEVSIFCECPLGTELRR